VPGAAAAVTGRLDVEAALARRDYMTSSWDDAGAGAVAAGQPDRPVPGTARLAGPRLVEVTAADGTVTRLTARRAIVLANRDQGLHAPDRRPGEARPWTNRK